MKAVIIALLGVLCFLGCKEEIKPSLSEEKMVDVLTDLHLAEASMLTLNKKLKDSVYLVYYGQIFEIHQVKDSVFFKDLELLRKDPERVEKVYAKVVDNIEQLDLKKEVDEPEKKK